eukprot:6724737-Pyramimonas_sp.AAC.1
MAMRLEKLHYNTAQNWRTHQALSTLPTLLLLMLVVPLALEGVQLTIKLHELPELLPNFSPESRGGVFTQISRSRIQAQTRAPSPALPTRGPEMHPGPKKSDRSRSYGSMSSYRVNCASYYCLRAPLDFKRDAVGYIGLCNSDMSQTRGFHSPRYRNNAYLILRGLTLRRGHET